MKRSLLCAALLVASVLWLPLNSLSAQQKNIVETAVSAGKFNTLVAAVKAADLAGALSGHKQLTVFAPTDEAFAALPAGTVENLLRPENKQQLVDILTYHVVPGRVNAKDAFDLTSAKTLNGQRAAIDFKGAALKIDNATINITDIQCSNGVIHVIDSVILPSSDTIPAIAQSANQFNTLLAAVGAAGLADVLGSKGPFTVFAPTDEAFSKLPKGTVETLLQPENKQKLIDILKYHVVSGRVYASDAVRAERANTLLGPQVNVSLSADGAKVNDAKLVKVDIEASNGVIHVVDSVLLPTQNTPTAVQAMIRDAIAQGAPVFNSGNHGRCCEIYTSTMNAIVNTGISGASEHDMNQIRGYMTSANQHHSTADRAWALRRGLEAVHTRMGQMPSTMPATMTSNR